MNEDCRSLANYIHFLCFVMIKGSYLIHHQKNIPAKLMKTPHKTIIYFHPYYLDLGYLNKKYKK